MSSNQWRVAVVYILSLWKQPFLRKGVWWVGWFFLPIFNRFFCRTFSQIVFIQRWQFLAHLSQRLKWAIVIAHRPSSVLKLSHFQLLLQNRWWIWMKLGRDEVFMVPYKCCCFSNKSAQGRIQGGAKIGHGGPLLQKPSSSGRKATATNQMLNNALKACGKKCCYFWFHSEVKSLFGLSHFFVF